MVDRKTWLEIASRSLPPKVVHRENLKWICRDAGWDPKVCGEELKELADMDIAHAEKLYAEYRSRGYSHENANIKIMKQFYIPPSFTSSMDCGKCGMVAIEPCEQIPLECPWCANDCSWAIPTTADCEV